MFLKQNQVHGDKELRFTSGLDNYLRSTLDYVCRYLFFQVECGRKNRQINPSQTLMNLEYCLSYPLQVAFRSTWHIECVR